MCSEKQNQRVLVTGGAGYMGSMVTRRLMRSGFAVTVLDNLMYGGQSLLGLLGQPDFTFIKGDIRKADDLKAALKDINYVVHLAAIVGEAACNRDKELAVAVNLEATKSLIDLSRDSGVERFVFLSTCSSYGVQDTSIMANEEAPLNPVSLYAETKIEAEKYLLNHVDDKFYCTILRPSTVHGPSPRMRFDLIVNHFVKDAYSTGRLDIYGGNLWRPLMWVGDAANATEMVLRASKHLVQNEVFNVGETEANYLKSDVGALIKEKFIPNLKLNHCGTDQDVRSYRVDFSKIHHKLGFKLTKSLEESIAELLDMLADGVITDYDSPKYVN